MNILLDGLDTTFKSTIAKKLSERLGFPILRGSSFELATGTNEELFNYSLSLLKKKYKIIERGHFSNLTYAPLYEGYTMITEEQRKILEDNLKNTLVIYTTAPTSVIVQRLQERGDEYINADYDEVDAISNKYTEVMSQSAKNGVRIHTFDTSILSSNDIVEQVIELFESMKHRIITEQIKNGSGNKNTNCNQCKKEIDSGNSYFSGTHCMNCYHEIMKELLN